MAGLSESAVRQAIYQLGLDSSQFDRAVASATQKGEQLAGSLGKVAVSEERVTAATRTTADGFARLEARYDPLIRAEQRRAAAIAQATRYLTEGSITQDRFAAQIARVNAFYEQQAGAANRAGIAIANNNRMLVGAGPTTRNYSTAIRLAGFQVADFAGGVASGENALRGFIRQGSLLLSFFGPWGAVLGGAVAVVGALVASLGLFGDRTKDGSDALSTYSDALKLSNELLLTAKERTDALTNSRLAEGRATLQAAVQEEQATISRLESIRTKQQQYFADIQGSIPNPFGQQQTGVPTNIISGLEAQLAGATRRAAELQGAIDRLADPANLGGARDAALREAGKAAEEAGKRINEAEKQRLKELDDIHKAAMASQVQREEGIEKRRQDIADRAAKARKEQLETEKNQAEERAKELRRPFDNAAENIQRAFGDLFTDIFDKGLDSFSDLAAAVRSTFVRLVGEIASLQLTKALFGGGLSFAGSGGQNAAGGLGNFGSISSLFGGGGGGGSLRHVGGAGSSAANFAGGGGFSWLGAGIGSALAALPLLTDLIGGNAISGKSAGGAIGGIAGSIGGAFLGPIGGILGGVGGQLLGSLLGGLFGSGPVPKAAAYTQATGGLLGGLGSAAKSGGAAGPVEQLRDQAVAQINAILGGLGGSLGTGGLGYFPAFGGIGAIANKAGSFYSVVGTKSESFGSGEAGARAVLANFVAEVLQQGSKTGLISGLSPNVRRVLGQSTTNDLASLDLDLMLARLADGLGNIAPSIQSFQTELRTLQAEFQKSAARAAELGLDVGPQLQSKLDVAKQALEQQYFGAFRDFERALTVSDLSTLSPTQKLFTARTQYEDIKRLALGGDETARGQFIGAAQSYLGFARSEFASTGSYDTIFQDVLGATRQLGAAPDSSAPVVSAVNTQTSALVIELNKVRDELVVVNAQLAAANNNSAAARAAVAPAGGARHGLVADRK